MHVTSSKISKLVRNSSSSLKFFNKNCILRRNIFSLTIITRFVKSGVVAEHYPLHDERRSLILESWNVHKYALFKGFLTGNFKDGSL
jgi:hypothetical protein